VNPIMTAVRAGAKRGAIEFRQTLTTPLDLWSYLFPAAALIVVMLFMRGHTVAGTSFSLGSRTLPSTLGLGIAFSGMITLATAITTEREDGTLLRAKAIPNGALGYLVGKIVLVSSMSVIGLVLQLVPGAVLFEGLRLNSVAPWLEIVGLVVLGLVATLPLGAILGSLFSSPRNIGTAILPIFALVAASGIFYPITNFPGWLQMIAQVFPIYWLGLGMRSALLPGDLAAVEIGHSWRHLETIGVLGAWAVIGLVIAPIVLRRMARRESGSGVQERREKALQRAR
jgi:ABC-2 type transport system permease protein